MKKLVALILALILCPVWSLAEIDLSGMTYDELVALKNQINLAIWSSDTWQEVEVPYGIWIVGEDIPAGKWTIKAAEGIEAVIYWGDKLEDSGVEISYKGSIYEGERITNPSYRYYEKGDPTEVTWDLKEGQYFSVNEGVAVFSPYSGKPSLGFK